jgi:hypothetical protein
MIGGKFKEKKGSRQEGDTFSEPFAPSERFANTSGLFFIYQRDAPFKLPKSVRLRK